MRSEALLGLGTRLEAALVESLTPHLEAHESAALRGGLAKAPRELEDVYDRVAEAGDVRIGMALEVAQSVYREVAERLTPQLRDRVAHALPPLWSACFSSRPHPVPPRISWFAQDPGRALPKGRPGGPSPLYAVGSSAVPEHTMDRVLEPHDAETQRPSSMGASAERTLAEARPPGRHSLH